jgi:hypothetical protein
MAPKRRVLVVLSGLLLSPVGVACNAILGNEILTPGDAGNPEDGSAVDAHRDGGGKSDADATTDVSMDARVDAKTDGPTCCYLSPDVCSEIHLNTDSKNCGACGHDCMGGECSGGVCSPLVLVTGLANEPWFVAADDAGNVYWSDTVPEVLGCIDGCAEAGATTVLNDLGTAGPTGVPIVIAENEVCGSLAPPSLYYFGKDTTVLVQQPPIGESRLIGGFFGVVSAEAASGSYAITCSNEGVNAWNITNCSALTMIPIASTATCAGVATDGVTVYWSDQDAETVSSAPIGDGATATLFSGSTGSAPGPVILVGDTLYFTLHGDGMVESIDRSTLGATEFASLTGSAPNQLAADLDKLYWTDNVGVAWCPLDAGCPSGTPHRLASVKGAFGVAVDSRAVYFSVQGPPNQVMRIVKP